MTRLLLTAASVLALTVGAAYAQSSSSGASGSIGGKSMSQPGTSSSGSSAFDKDCDTPGQTTTSHDSTGKVGTLGMNSKSSAGTSTTACPPGSGSSVAPPLDSKGSAGSSSTGGSSSGGLSGTGR